MSRPWVDFESRRAIPPLLNSGNDYVPDLYAGPQEYMEVGARGFLVNTMVGKEEVGIDEAISLLRQAAIKLYGGIKAKSKKSNESRGYVRVDYIDPDLVTILPAPEGEEEEEVDDEKEIEEVKPSDELADQASTDKLTQEAASDAKEKSSSSDQEGSVSKSDESQVQEAVEDQHKQKVDAVDKVEEATEDKEKKPANASSETDSKTTELATDTDTKTGAVVLEMDKKTTEVASDTKPEAQSTIPWMKSSYKFKTYRTEIKNLVFIKSNVPDPVLLSNTFMEIILARKQLPSDAIRQLLPVLGICQNEYLHLEAMASCVLKPVFDEALKPKSFGIFLLDKMSDPNADLFIETIRNNIWAINPLAWQSSPLTEPDFVIRLELIGKKLVLSCLTHFMRYRHYNPKQLVESGLGEPEDDDGTWVPTEVRKMEEAYKAEREKRRELERQREEEYRKERERRREEAEARRRERIQREEKEREERRQEREREKEKEREREREKERERVSKTQKKDIVGTNEGNKDDTQKEDAANKVEDTASSQDSQMNQEPANADTNKVLSGEQKELDLSGEASQAAPVSEVALAHEEAMEVETASEEVSDVAGGHGEVSEVTGAFVEARETTKSDDPPAKKQKLEVEEDAGVEEDKDENVDEAEEEDEEEVKDKSTSKKGARGKKGSRRRSRK